MHTVTVSLECLSAAVLIAICSLVVGIPLDLVHCLRMRNVSKNIPLQRAATPRRTVASRTDSDSHFCLFEVDARYELKRFITGHIIYVPATPPLFAHAQ